MVNGVDCFPEELEGQQAGMALGEVVHVEDNGRTALRKQREREGVSDYQVWMFGREVGRRRSCQMIEMVMT